MIKKLVEIKIMSYFDLWEFICVFISIEFFFKVGVCVCI